MCLLRYLICTALYELMAFMRATLPKGWYSAPYNGISSWDWASGFRKWKTLFAEVTILHIIPSIWSISRVSNQIGVPQKGILSSILAMFSNIVDFGWDEHLENIISQFLKPKPIHADWTENIILFLHGPTKAKTIVKHLRARRPWLFRTVRHSVKGSQRAGFW